MKLKVFPKTLLGKLSVLLIILTPFFFIFGMSFVSFYEGIFAGKSILQDIISRPGIAIPMIVGFFAGIAAFFTGLTAIIREKDYSVLVFVSTFLGFLVLLWVLAEFLFPH